MTKNALGSIFFLTFSSFYFYNVFNIKKMPGSQFEVMTASTFPFYLGLSGIILSIILLVISLINKDNDKLEFSYLKTLDFKTTSIFIILMIFYGFAMKTFGFIVATFIFLLVGFITLKEKNLKRIFITAITISIGFYLLLNNILGVYIDLGILGELFLGENS